MTMSDKENTLYLTGGPSSLSYYEQTRTVGPGVAAALVLAQAMVRDAGKSGENKFDKYTYSKLEDFLAACDMALSSNALALAMDTIECMHLADRITKNGGAEHCVQVKVRGTLIHGSGETFVAFSYGEGQDRGDKATYKAITGAKKYLVAGLMKIATTDDPEADETVGLAPKAGTKVNSKGDTYTKQPAWTAEQKAEAGEIRACIIAMGGDPADKEVIALRNRMKGDTPSDMIDALNELKNKWADIAGAES